MGTSGSIINCIMIESEREELDEPNRFEQATVKLKEMPRIGIESLETVNKIGLVPLLIPFRPNGWDMAVQFNKPSSPSEGTRNSMETVVEERTEMVWMVGVDGIFGGGGDGDGD